MDFETFFIEKTKNTPNNFFNYKGISKKDYSKWQGWKIIQDLRENNVNIKVTEDLYLNLLVRNFYFSMYLKEKFIKNKF